MTPSEETIDAYLLGDGATLAHAINNRYGWPIRGLVMPYAERQVLIYSWVQHPSGKGLSITGLEEEAAIADVDPSATIRTLSVAELLDLSGIDDACEGYTVDFREAELIVGEYIAPKFLWH